MLFVDYVFDLTTDGSIRFEPDLKPELIGVKDGDEFVIAIVNERIVFIKKGN